jgi:hypothetical protein
MTRILLLLNQITLQTYIDIWSYSELNKNEELRGMEEEVVVSYLEISCNALHLHGIAGVAAVSQAGHIQKMTEHY